MATALSTETRKDYTCYPTIVPGDELYERLRVENPRKLKRLMKSERELYEETKTPEHQQRMAESAAWANVKVAEMLASGEFARVFGKVYTDKNERALLGLGPDDDLTKRGIRNAYRRMSRKLHPDVGGNAEAFKAMHTAYRTLLKLAKS